jgi:O-antigen ligase
MPLLAFLVTVGYLPGVLSASSSPRWWIIFVGAFALLALRGWRGERGRITAGHVLFGLMWLCAAISGLWSVSPYDTVGELMQLTGLAVVFHLSAQLKDTRAVWLAMGLGLIPSLIVSVMQLMGFNLVDRVTAPPTGLFLNKNSMGEIAAVVMLALAGFGLRGQHTLVSVTALSVAGWCAIVSNSRAVWLSLVVVALLYVITKWSVSWRHVGVLLLTVVFSLVLGSQFIDPARLATLEARLGIWSLTLDHLRWFGWGYGAYGAVFDFEYAHNEILHYAFELGLLSLPFFALAVYVTEGELGPDRLSFIGMLVIAMASFPLHLPATAFAACVAAGYLCGARSRAGDSKLAGRAVGYPYFRTGPRFVAD